MSSVLLILQLTKPCTSCVNNTCNHILRVYTPQHPTVCSSSGKDTLFEVIKQQSCLSAEMLCHYALSRMQYAVDA